MWCSRTCEPHYCSELKPCILQRDWMKDLDDNMLLYQLTIPGTHNSLSLYGTIIAITQTWDLESQLNAGIRWFDCRLRMRNNLLRFQHGIMDQRINFDVGLRIFKKFLVQHPKEFIIITFKKEYREKNCTKSFEELKNFYLKDYEDMIVNYNKDNNIPVSKLRGKILTINKNKQDIYNSSSFQIQNNWVVNLPRNIRDKKRLIKTQFNRAIFFENKSTKLFQNMLSGVSDYAIVTPSMCAYETNKVPFRFNGRMGAVIMDFPGEKLIDHLIKQNFRLKEEHPSEENKKIMDGSIVSIRNINTNKYLVFRDDKAFCQKGENFFTIWKNNPNYSPTSDKESEKEIISGDDIVLKSKDGTHPYFYCFVQRKKFIEEDFGEHAIHDFEVAQLFIILQKGEYRDINDEKKYICSDYSKKRKTKIRKNNGKKFHDQIVYFTTDENFNGTEWEIKAQ